MHRIKLLSEAFDPWLLLSEAEQQWIAEGKLNRNATGATASFVGRMRDFNEGDAITAMQLDHYPGMTEKQLVSVADNSVQNHDIDQVFIAHRVGIIKPGEAIVLIAVWSAHRKAAFDTSREIMEILKHTAPFWKKEVTLDGARWVNTNTAD